METQKQVDWNQLYLINFELRFSKSRISSFVGFALIVLSTINTLAFWKYSVFLSFLICALFTLASARYYLIGSKYYQDYDESIHADTNLDTGHLISLGNKAEKRKIVTSLFLYAPALALLINVLVFIFVGDPNAVN